MLKSSIHLVFCKELSHLNEAQSYAFNFKKSYPAGLILCYFQQSPRELFMSGAVQSKYQKSDTEGLVQAIRKMIFPALPL
jgi:hypothetical protein